MRPGPDESFVRDALPPASLQPDFLVGLPEHAYPEQLNAAAEEARVISRIAAIGAKPITPMLWQ